MKKSDLIFLAVITVVIFAVLILTEGLKAQQPPAAPPSPMEVRPFSPMGKLAAKTIHQDIQNVQNEIQEFIRAEMAAQKVTEQEGWNVNLQTDQMERRAAPQAQVAPKPSSATPPITKPTIPTPASPKQLPAEKPTSK
jgi:hypothetical protein